jgi:hypothetical protein
MAVCLYDCGPFIYYHGHFISMWAFMLYSGRFYINGGVFI